MELGRRRDPHQHEEDEVFGEHAADVVDMFAGEGDADGVHCDEHERLQQSSPPSVPAEQDPDADGAFEEAESLLRFWLAYWQAFEHIHSRQASGMQSLWGLVADIHPTTYELRLGILEAKAEKLGGQIPPKVLEFLAHKITSNVRELEGALNRITAHAQLVGRAIDIEMAQEVLHDLLRANDRRVTIDEIQKRVAEHYNIRLADMHSERRARAVARPRQVAMWLCKQLTQRSLPEIGRKFGGRDHTTVMHAVRKIDELRAGDRSMAEDIELLRRMLET